MFDGFYVQDILTHWASVQPDALAYRYITDGLQGNCSITYFELYKKSLALSGYIRNSFLGVSKDNNVAVLVYPSGLEFLIAFFACMYAGVVAVPVSVPRRNRTADRLQNILIDSKPKLILTTESISEAFPEDIVKNGKIQIIATDRYAYSSNNYLLGDKDYRSSISFLQYTSGTTNQPKGVVVTHRNIVSNQQMIQKAFGHDKNTIFGGWLPLYHDMGLIGNILQPLYLGIPSILMSPVSFLSKPYNWLKLISDYRVTTSGAPNFAYDLCVEQIALDELSSLDLTSWNVAFNGAEHIQAKTIRNFSKKFAVCGFRENMFFPCYGLAEATLFVSGADLNNRPKVLRVDKALLEKKEILSYPTSSSNAKELVSVGLRPDNETVIIVNKDTNQRCEVGIVGEIWINGDNVAYGYKDKSDATQELFKACLANDYETTFLRTGDLGFIDHNNELFVVGRCKDLIIINGRNIYPQDIEITVCELSKCIATNGCAAFSVMDEDVEKLVVVVELKRTAMRLVNYTEMIKEIKRSILIEFQIDVYTVCFVKPNRVPKTSSGKIQRSLCKKMFMKGELEIIEIFMHQKEALISDLLPCNAELYSLVTDILQCSISVKEANKPLYLFGLDSIKAIQIQSKLFHVYNALIEFDELLQNISLRDIEQRCFKSNKIVKDDCTSLSVNKYPCSCQQSDLWVFRQMYPGVPAYNVGRIIKSGQKIECLVMKRAIEYVCNRNPMLRTFFYHCDRGLEQMVAEKAIIDIDEHTLSSDGDLNSFMNGIITTSLNLNELPLFKFAICHIDNEDYLCVVAHHIICDLWSFGVLVQQLFFAYQSIIKGENLSDHYVDYGYSYFVDYQRQYMQSKQKDDDISYWLQQCPRSIGSGSIPLKKNRPTIKTYEGSCFPIDISSKLAEKIQQLSGEKHVSEYVILLTAYMLMIRSYANKDNVVIGSTMHGRKLSNWYETIGNFVNPLPVMYNFYKDDLINDILPAMQKLVIENYRHSFCPLSVLLQEYKKIYKDYKYNPALSPLFQEMFVYQRVADINLHLSSLAVPMQDKEMNVGGFKFSPYQWIPPYSNFDLTLFLTNDAKNFFGYFEYNINLFLDSDVKELAERFLSILDLLSDNLQRSVYDVLLASV